MFYTIVFIAIFGSFCLRTLMKLKCKDFELSFVYDSNDPIYYKFVVIPTINKNKIKKSQKISRYKIQLL